MNAPALRSHPVPVVASRACRGVSMVELIVFIVITGIVVAALISGIAAAVRTAPVPKVMHQGLQIAQGRMELILAQRKRLGFSSFTSATFDPCQPPGGAQEACLAPAVYAATACFYTGAGTCAFGAPNTCQSGDADSKCVRVRVTGSDGSTLALVDAMVANY